jgi:SH3 domain-containing YSC84-like protein 1
MIKRLLVFLSLCVCCLASARAASGEQEVVNQATTILREFRAMPETGIPRSVLRKARGLAIIKVVKVGFGVSGKGGEGVVVARTGDGWSGPSFIGTGGVGFGFQFGAQVTQFVVVLNTRAAVRAFSRDGNVTLGADLSAAAGPVGRNLQAGVLPTAAVYTYSRSKGLFAGASLEGALIGTQKDANWRYYGRRVRASEILSGEVAAPSGAHRLIATLER